MTSLARFTIAATAVLVVGLLHGPIEYAATHPVVWALAAVTVLLGVTAAAIYDTARPR